MRSNIYRYVGVVLVVVGIVLSATGVTFDAPPSSVQEEANRTKVETLDVIDENLTEIAGETYDDKVANSGIGIFFVLLGTFILSGHYLLKNRPRREMTSV